MENEGDGDVVTMSLSGGDHTYTIVRALSEATGSRPMDIPPLHQSIDTDALSTLIRGEKEGVHVQFTHCGCDVTVADGVVTVEWD